MRVYLDVMKNRPMVIVARYHRLSGIVQVVNKVYRKSYDIVRNDYTPLRTRDKARKRYSVRNHSCF